MFNSRRVANNLCWQATGRRPTRRVRRRTSKLDRVFSTFERKERKMSQGMPSMTALLGMVALAGYQNRDKITEMLTGAGTSGPNTGAGQSGLGRLLGSLGGLLGGAGSTGGTGGAGNLLNNGLNELLDSFKQNGQGDTAQSWIEPGPNKEISPPQLKQA